MELKEIQQKWSLIRPENVSGFRSLRMSGICKPDLFIAVDEKGDRCLLLRLPPEGKPGFQPSEKRNLSLAFFKEKRIIVLKLHYKEFNDLFDDLILSLYHKVKDIENSKEYIREFVQCFYKWSEFFDNRQPDKLSVEKIQGLIGEILVLNDLIKDGDPTYVDDILRSWRGPFEDVHDFIFQDRSIEVKTRDAANADVSISSEYQLQQEQGKDLK
ncbi:MAG: PD-(D/E)XK motif protein, partial [Sphingobacteriales bacterium]